MANLLFAHERHPFLIVGDRDYDEQRMNILVEQLLKIGYTMIDEDWMVGGSQEISLYRFERGRNKLVLQAETCEDLMLFGVQELLDEVQPLFLQNKDTV